MRCRADIGSRLQQIIYGDGRQLIRWREAEHLGKEVVLGGHCGADVGAVSEAVTLVVEHDMGDRNATAAQCRDHRFRLIRRHDPVEGALEEDRRSRKNNPRADDQDNAAYVDSLGWALFRLGKLDEARKELERATQLPDGDDPVIHDHLGDVNYRLEQPTAARAAWRKAAELYESENLRRRDERYQEVLRKLKRVEAELKSR